MRTASLLSIGVVTFLLAPYVVAQDQRPLIRAREGGTPYDSQQSLTPYSVQAPATLAMPGSGLIASPPEYAPTSGVMFMFKYGHWHEVVVDCVAALTGDPAYDDIAYVLVNSSQQSMAESRFIAAGADMSKVVFYNVTSDSVWLRDYGPHYICQDDTISLVDSHYYRERPNDNFIPTKFGDDYFNVQTYDTPLMYAGGNFQPGPDRSGFVTALIRLDNPPSQDYDDAYISELFRKYQGVDVLHIMPQLPTSVDGTGHIDMWMYLVDEDSVMISEFIPGSNPTAIQITNDAVSYMEGLGFEVYRPPAWTASHPEASWQVHYTYTNAFRINDRIFISSYGEGNASYLDEDAQALALWQAAAGPDVEIVVIDCYPIIWAMGAIHCTVMQVPNFIDDAPAVHVVSPSGGELLISGSKIDIQWEATDTDLATIPTIDLYYSTNDGADWTHIVTTADTGSYSWSVPTVFTTQARVKVVATSADSDEGEGVSEDVFQIAPGTQSLYDFSDDAGVDRFAYGHYTSSWNSVDETRRPVNTDVESLQSGAYDKMAVSDAAGGDTDANRYQSPTPSSGRESTHIFEFTVAEDPDQIDQIEIICEAYADNGVQLELYIWDYIDGQWCDGGGLFGQNRMMDLWAGINRDETLYGRIRSHFDRYIDDSGQLTLLTYADRVVSRSFVDYFAVLISTADQLGDVDGDGDVDLADLAALLASYGKTAGEPGFNPNADFDGDGDVDLADLAELLANYGA